MAANIVIAGAGLVGLGQALLLAQQGIPVLVVDPKNLQVPKLSGLDRRGIALAWHTRQILEQMGFWSEVKANAQAIQQVHVSRQGYWGQSYLRHQDYDLPALGYVIGAHDLAAVFLDAAQRHPLIELRAGTRLELLCNSSSGVELELYSSEASHKLKADLLIVADGAESGLRKRLDIDVEQFDYQQDAVVCNVQTARINKGWAFERFTHDGPMAMLPLSENSSALVWSNSVGQAQKLLELNEPQFLQALEKSFGLRLGRLLKASPRARQGLKMQLAKRLYRGRCVLVGNAAASLHPVAGQGLNLALRDVQSISDLLSRGLKAGSDSFFAHYERARGQDRQQVIAMGHGLVQLFSQSAPAYSTLMGSSLSGLDLLSPMRHWLAAQGMGLNHSPTFNLEAERRHVAN